MMEHNIFCVQSNPCICNYSNNFFPFFFLVLGANGAVILRCPFFLIASKFQLLTFEMRKREEMEKRRQLFWLNLAAVFLRSHQSIPTYPIPALLPVIKPSSKWSIHFFLSPGFLSLLIRSSLDLVVGRQRKEAWRMKEKDVKTRPKQSKSLFLLLLSSSSALRHSKGTRDILICMDAEKCLLFLLLAFAFSFQFVRLFFFYCKSSSRFAGSGRKNEKKGVNPTAGLI